MKSALILGIVSLLSTSAAIAAEHPSEAFTAAAVRQGYDTGSYGYPVEWSIQDIVFLRHPAATSLSAAERYMLFGTEAGETGEQVIGLSPWWDTVYTLVAAYDSKHGQIPTELSLEVIRSIPGLENTTADSKIVALARSPITGKLPKLNASEFSAGDVFIKRLTDAEIQELGNHDRTLKDLHSENKFYSTPAEEPRPAKLISPVYYLKIHGDEDTIETRLVYNFAFTDSKSE
jgi:hypothetical protein